MKWIMGVRLARRRVAFILSVVLGGVLGIRLGGSWGTCGVELDGGRGILLMVVKKEKEERYSERNRDGGITNGVRKGRRGRCRDSGLVESVG